MNTKFISPTWPVPKHIKAFITLRSAWDEINNTQSLIELLQLPEEPIWLNQTHSTKVVEALDEHKGHNADASFTSQENKVCIVFTADCLPVLFCNSAGNKVAAVHAGWRGLANGILEATFHSIHTKGLSLSNKYKKNEDWLVWLGPAIGPQKFEVGKDVFDAFNNGNEEVISAFIPWKKNKWLANLYAIARLKLNVLGINRIYGGEFCTYTQEKLFFSYRREQGKNTGRMASLIWISHK